MSRPRRSRRAYYRRSFLNRPGHHAGAYVIAEVTVGGDEDRRRVDAELTIADCSRVTTLEFYVDSRSSAAERSNAVHKARVLREVVTAFTAQLEAALSQDS